MSDLVTIIIPVYNVEKYLPQCIESVINQTYKNLEIILINDGSSDSSGKICEKYAEVDKRIKVIHKENGGLSTARNIGIEKCARGGYLMFVDSDDWIELDMVGRMLEYANKYSSDIVDCGYILEFINNNERVRRSNCVIYKDNVLQKSFLDLYITCIVWKKLYRKEIFNDIRFPVGKINEDIFIFLKTLEKCRCVVAIPDCLYHYRQRFGSIVNNKFNIQSLDAIEAFEKDLLFAKEKNFTKIISKAESALLYCKKDKITKILLDKNKYKYFEIAIELQKSIRENLLNIIMSKEYSIKQKIYFPLIAYSLKAYGFILQVQNKLKGNTKKYYE